MKRNCKYIPNGYYDVMDKSIDNLKKENVFLTVGRLGTEQKNTEELIDAFCLIVDKCNWNLKLIGPYTDEIKLYIESRYAQNPSLKNRIYLMGGIKDKELLISEYNKASIFVMPSKWESFGIVIIEAMSRGCYVILSDLIPPANDFIDGGKCGEIYSCGNIEQLSELMLTAARNKLFNENYISNRTENVFNWSNIVNKLFLYLR